MAFVGKGGAGKSSLAGTFARSLAATGARVLALDSDPMPGLAFSLGAPQSDAGLPDDAVEDYQDDDGRRRYRLRAGLSGTEAVERYGHVGPGGVHFLQLGKARGPTWNNTRQHFAFQRVLDDLPGEGWSVVGDLPGGTRQPFMTWGRYARTFVVVVEPTAGEVIAGPLYDDEGMLVADCDLRRGLHAKRFFDAVGHYSRADVLPAPPV